MDKTHFRIINHDDLHKMRDKIKNGSIIIYGDASGMYVKLHDKSLPMTPKWTKKYVARKCVNCGAPLDFDGFVIKCPYCGTVYDVDYE